jgi:hypothetical protein
MEQNRGRLETDDHSSCPKRPRLKLHHILVDQLDTRAGSRRVADLDNRDGTLGEGGGGFHDGCVLRNSDRRF